MFNDELNAVKKELTQKSIPQSSSHPKFAGQALWARQLKRRIERSMGVSDITNITTKISVFKCDYIHNHHFKHTVKPILSGHSKIYKTKILKTHGNLMKVQSIAECSP